MTIPTSPLGEEYIEEVKLALLSPGGIPPQEEMQAHINRAVNGEGTSIPLTIVWEKNGERLLIRLWLKTNSCEFSRDTGEPVLTGRFDAEQDILAPSRQHAAAEELDQLLMYGTLVLYKHGEWELVVCLIEQLPL